MRSIERKKEKERQEKESETGGTKEEKRTDVLRFSDRAVCTRTREEDSGDVTGEPFPLSRGSTHTPPPPPSRRTIWQQWLAITDIVAVD